MYLQELLEVAIGLIFVWMVLSIAAMQIQEWFANFLGQRAADLEESIRDMLVDDEMIKQFYNHPLIKSLHKPISDSNKKKIEEIEKKSKHNWRDKHTLWWLTRKPSYIPSRNFSLALFDIVAKAGTEYSPIHSKLNQLRDEVEFLAVGDREAVKGMLDRIYQAGQKAAASERGTEIQNSLKDELKKQVERLGAKFQGLKPITDQLKSEIDNAGSNLTAFFKSEKVLDQVRAGTIALGTNTSLSKTINSLLAGVEETATGVDKALATGRKNVAEWFDNSMERVSGWYKRWAQKILFWIGLTLALILNIDSIALAEHLWREPAVRQALVATSEKFITENQEPATEGIQPDQAIKQFRARFEGLNLPIGWKLKEYTGKKTVSLLANTNEVAGICIKKIIIWKVNFNCYELVDPPENGQEILLKTLGILFTALATMQGAPYWFDILKKLINIRSSGINPAEKPKESASDRER